MEYIISKFRSPTFKNFFNAIFLSSSYYLIQFLFTKLISVKLTIEEFGDYRYFFAILALSNIFNLGFIDGFQTEWIVNKREINFKYIYGACIVTLATSFFSFFLFKGTELRFLIIINILIVNFGLILQYVFIKYHFFLFYLIQLIFSQLVQILILFFIHSKFSLVDVLYMHSGINFLILLTAYLYSIRKKYIQRENSLEFDTGKIINYIKNGAPILLSGIVLVGFQNIDKLILKGKYSETDYGYYAFASLIAMVVYGIFASLANVLFKKIVDTEKIDKLYNNTIYLILLIPLLAILSKGIVAKGIAIFFSKFTPSYQYYIGFANFYFPMLANIIVILNVYKKHKQVTLFAIIAFTFLLLMTVFLLFSNQLKLKLTDIPYAMSVIVCLWFFVNDFALSYKNPPLYKKYWQRTLLCSSACVIIFLVTYYFR